MIFGHVREDHEEFSFHITGDASVGLADYEETENEERSSIFRYPHGLNRPGEAIIAYYRKLDPTNNLPVTDSHIKIGTGRDAGDCMINRGIMLGGGNQSQNICVSVEER